MALREKWYVHTKILKMLNADCMYYLVYVVDCKIKERIEFEKMLKQVKHESTGTI